MELAPFFDEIADGPANGKAYWAKAADGVRVRLGYWAGSTEKGAAPTKGTILLFPGRTEYIEKYGRAATEFGARGYGTFAIDWRGQGLADRLLDDRRIGHINDYKDYQKDADAMIAMAEKLDLPRPWFLLAHSMGGAIGLRSLMNGLPVNAAAFSAPMWGIGLAASTRPVAWAMSWMAGLIGVDHKISPGAALESYVMSEPFEDNKLTTDPEMYKYMQSQTGAHSELALGGPSLRWLQTSLSETHALAAAPSPATPTITFLGSDERIVDTARVHHRMIKWPSGHLEMINCGQHEVIMEAPHIRTQVFDQTTALFDKHNTNSTLNATQQQTKTA